MIISGEVGSLQNKLQQLQKQQCEIDGRINQIGRAKSGVLNMDFFRLKKQKEEIREEVVKIHGMLRPNIIA